MQWRACSPWKNDGVIRYLPYVLSLALTVYCLVDAIQADDQAVRNLPKIAWLILILLFPPLPKLCLS